MSFQEIKAERLIPVALSSRPTCVEGKSAGSISHTWSTFCMPFTNNIIPVNTLCIKIGGYYCGNVMFAWKDLSRLLLGALSMKDELGGESEVAVLPARG